ncbi:MAG: NAD(P)-binding protein [Coriobacteriales bacterium]|jgi:glycine/D-amino acid oxidase-like deaminating enzyme|nr:NAD(P)-binding protein [Coriobacteriales bacterium]
MPNKQQKHVAVIGAGAAGSLAAYQIHKRLGDKVQITVFERNEHPGGRAWDVDFAGLRIEIGGTLLHSTGQHTMELMQFTDSKAGQSGLNIDGKDETYAFWTEKGFPIVCHTSMASMATGIVKHVGVSSALKVTNAAKKMAAQWERIYELQATQPAVKTPDEMLRALGLYEPTQISFGDYFKKLGVNARMTHDVVEAITHNMYNQGAEMNALAGLVGLAGAGLAGGYLFAIEGGNWTIYDKTLAKIGAVLYNNTKVDSVEVITASRGAPDTTSKGFSDREAHGASDAASEGVSGANPEAPLSSFVLTAQGEKSTFDAVVLAAPPALANIEFLIDGRPLPITVHPYQQVQTNLVVGSLNPDYFGLKPGKRVPSTVFVATSSGAPFKSVGITGYSPLYQSRIYKVFSAEHVMQRSELEQMFTSIHDVLTFVWPGAYPVLTPGIKHVPFELRPGFYFACAFETAAGAIETESVSGVNAGNLAADYLEAQ